jgi:Tfp pilus assembly protein PilV
VRVGAARGIAFDVRKGFPLIEVLVALLIFEFGMLALAATSAVIARDLGAATRRARAHAQASHRVEGLRGTACSAGNVTAGLTHDGLTEVWRVDATGDRRALADSVSFALSNGRRSHVVLRAWLLCRP